MFWNKENAIANISKMAASCRANRDFAKAKSLYTCLIPMIKQETGSESVELALNFYRLAETYSDEGNYAAADTYYERALEVWRKHGGSSDDGLWHVRALQSIHDAMVEADNLALSEPDERIA